MIQAVIHQLDLLAGISAPLPRALLNTLLVPAVIFLLGLAITGINNIITQLIAAAAGSRAAGQIRNYFTYPGTIHHELAHALFAVLTGARVIRITLRPKGDTLGSVEFIPRGNAVTKSIQVTLASIAPVVCGIGTLALLWFFVFPLCFLWWHYAIFTYGFLCVLLHMNMSSQDIKNALRGTPVCMLLLFLVFLFLKVNLLQELILLFRGLSA
jgi:hypothetical protein